jgi:hypothetical protein
MRTKKCPVFLCDPVGDQWTFWCPTARDTATGALIATAQKEGQRCSKADIFFVCTRATGLQKLVS